MSHIIEYQDFNYRPFILIYDKTFKIIFAHDENIIRIFFHIEKFIGSKKI
jgi:hypothetical protein